MKIANLADGNVSGINFSLLFALLTRTGAANNRYLRLNLPGGVNGRAVRWLIVSSTPPLENRSRESFASCANIVQGQSLTVKAALRMSAPGARESIFYLPGIYSVQPVARFDRDLNVTGRSFAFLRILFANPIVALDL